MYRIIPAAILAALVLVTPAAAVAPLLGAVTPTDGYAGATFTAPRSTYITFYVASKPDRATDGQFLEGNVVLNEILTNDEAASGVWRSETKLPDGSYWVMMEAQPDQDCFIEDHYDEACANGYSNVVAFKVAPPPSPRYTGTVKPSKAGGPALATLRATGLTVRTPYKLCFTSVGKKRCLAGVLTAAQPSSSTLRVPSKGLATTTTFTWVVAGKTVATKRAKVR